MRLCIDIDGTICRFRETGEGYAEVTPLPGAVERMKSLKAAGHYLILLTARHMATTGGNPGLAVARQGKTLFDWLARHDIPYDELWFGKPQADLYIDDNGYRFTSWSDIAEDGSNLPVNREKAKAAGTTKV
jgi:capsule biosynthesis phosphatase